MNLLNSNQIMKNVNGGVTSVGDNAVCSKIHQGVPSKDNVQNYERDSFHHVSLSCKNVKCEFLPSVKVKSKVGDFLFDTIQEEIASTFSPRDTASRYPLASFLIPERDKEKVDFGEGSNENLEKVSAVESRLTGDNGPEGSLPKINRWSDGGRRVSSERRRYGMLFFLL